MINKSFSPITFFFLQVSYFKGGRKLPDIRAIYQGDKPLKLFKNLGKCASGLLLHCHGNCWHCECVTWLILCAVAPDFKGTAAASGKGMPQPFEHHHWCYDSVVQLWHSYQTEIFTLKEPIVSEEKEGRKATNTWMCTQGSVYQTRVLQLFIFLRRRSWNHLSLKLCIKKGPCRLLDNSAHSCFSGNT